MRRFHPLSHFLCTFSSHPQPTTTGSSSSSSQSSRGSISNSDGDDDVEEKEEKIMRASKQKMSPAFPSDENFQKHFSSPQLARNPPENVEIASPCHKLYFTNCWAKKYALFCMENSLLSGFCCWLRPLRVGIITFRIFCTYFRGYALEFTSRRRGPNYTCDWK